MGHTCSDSVWIIDRLKKCFGLISATAFHSCTVIHVVKAIKERYLQAVQGLRVKLLFCLTKYKT